MRKLRKRRVRLAGSRGRPVGVVNTSPLSLQSGPAVSHSLSCRPLCSLREWRHSVGRAMRRSDARVLVGRWVRPPLRVRWSERRMLAVPVVRSRSSQWRPGSSPLRSPVRRASLYRGRGAGHCWLRGATAELHTGKGLKRRGRSTKGLTLRATLRSR
ncbi:hypothetical protein STAN_2266 [Streptomyces sp. CBMAI 2042]|nr:hypothetical protein STAN_2266 [Streptomyces sp. CBMAI 2042]